MEVPLNNVSVVNSWNYRVVTHQVPLDSCRLCGRYKGTHRTHPLLVKEDD